MNGYQNYNNPNGFYPRFPPVRSAYQFRGSEEDEAGQDGSGKVGQDGSGDPRQGCHVNLAYESNYNAKPTSDDDDDDEEKTKDADTSDSDDNDSLSSTAVGCLRFFGVIICILSFGSVGLGAANLYSVYRTLNINLFWPLNIPITSPANGICSSSINILILWKAAGLFAFPVFITGLLACCLHNPSSKQAGLFLFLSFLSAFVLTTGMIVMTAMICYCTMEVAGGVSIFDFAVGGLAILECLLTTIAYIFVCRKKCSANSDEGNKKQLPKPDSIESEDEEKLECSPAKNPQMEPEQYPQTPPAQYPQLARYPQMPPPQYASSLPPQFSPRQGIPPPLPPDRVQTGYGIYPQSRYPLTRQPYTIDRARQPYNPYQNPYGRPGYDRTQSPYGRLY